MLSVNLSSKEFQKADSTEFKELQNRLRKVNLRWEKATHALDNWRKGLRQALLHCQVHTTCSLYGKVFWRMFLWDGCGERTKGQSPTCLQNDCSQYGTPISFHDKLDLVGFQGFGKDIFELDNALFILWMYSFNESLPDYSLIVSSFSSGLGLVFWKCCKNIFFSLQTLTSSSRTSMIRAKN